jgi:hypothetical protein
MANGLGANYKQRRKSVRNQRSLIVSASIASLLFTPSWGFLRLFYCWAESRSGWVDFLCGFHWVITFLLVFFVGDLAYMAYQLTRISKEAEEKLPRHVDHPWIPGTKLAASGTSAVSKAAGSLYETCQHNRGLKFLASGVDGIGKSLKAIPGSKYIGDGARAVQDFGLEFEHGRTLCQDDKPGFGTLLFTLIAFGAVLFMVFGPFNFIFFA